MALFPAARFIVAVGGCALVSAEPVVIDAVAPGVGPEPASLPRVLQEPAYALPTLKITLRRLRGRAVLLSLVFILRRAASSALL